MTKLTDRTAAGVGVLVAALLLASVIALVRPTTGDAQRPTAHASAATASAPIASAPIATSSPALRPAATPAPPSALSGGTRPVQVRIPSINVVSGLQSLGVTGSGELQTPSKWQRAGWYSGGIRPGEVGPAVIAGHIDSRSGPAVFARLDELRSGSTVLVTRADRSVLHFTVDRVQRFAKKTFPTDAVYGPTSLPVLRLITCTGHFDRADRNYLDNLVVTTHLVSS